MSNKFLWVIIAILLGWIGWFYLGSQEESAVDSAPSAAGEREVLYWQAPMDPNYRRDKPGKSPMGMDLVPVYAEDIDAQAGVVKIDPTVVNNLGVRTAHAIRSGLPRQINSLAYVQYDENQATQVNTRIDGWVEQLWVRAIGETVAPGAPLFAIYSPALVAAQEEYLAALQHGAESIVQASGRRLLTLGADSGLAERIAKTGEPERTVVVRANSGGVVLTMDIREGAYVTPGTRLLSLAGLDPVWVITEVFEKQAAWIDDVEEAQVFLDSFPGQTFSARLDYVYPEVDQKTRTLKLRLKLPNPDGRLRPNMFGRVVMDIAAQEESLHVPREAVIRGGSADRVVLSIGNNRYQSQQVLTGIEAGERVEILQGLREHDVVVVSGQFLIDSESSITAALERFSDPATGHDAADGAGDDEDSETDSHAHHEHMEH